MKRYEGYRNKLSAGAQRCGPAVGRPQRPAQALVSARAGDAAWSELLHQVQAVPGTPLIGMGLESSTGLGNTKQSWGGRRAGGGGRISRKNVNPSLAPWPWSPSLHFLCCGVNPKTFTTQEAQGYCLKYHQS